MRLDFRVKLFGLVGVTAAVLVAIVVASSVVTARVAGRLEYIQRRYVPLVELEPELEAGLERIERGFQDAVAAHDLDALASTQDMRRDFLDRLDAAHEATDPADAAALRQALEGYFQQGYQVSRRLIAGETGEGLVDSIAAMQASQARTLALVKQTAALDRSEMSTAFAAAIDAEARARRYRLWLSVVGMVFAVVLSLGLSRGLLRSVRSLTAGFARFGRGDFGEPIAMESNDELGQLARAANTMADSLDRLDKERRRVENALQSSNQQLEAFSYSVAHDLRAPLRGINGYSRALVEDYGDKLDAEAHEYLERISAATQRMAELIDALLALSRVTRAEFRREPVDLGAMADAVVKQLRAGDPVRTVAFESVEGAVARCDGPLLRALLENLLGNAWKFSSKASSPRIAFGVETGSGTPVYYVRDNGAGFDMAYAQKLFAPFQRLHSQKEFAGTGIGLATVQRIVQRHGGKIWAEGAVGQGATFRFTLSGTEQGDEA